MPAGLLLVVPCYNEAERMNVDAFLDALQQQPNLNLLLVDDGSVDRTPAILADALARGGGRITVLSLTPNVGKGEAVRRGMLTAFDGGAAVAGFWDADLATPLAALPAFVDVLEQRPDVDIVMGARLKLLGRHVQRSLLRHYCGRIFATAASFALGIDVYDTQCGAKIFRATPIVRGVFATPFRSKWIFDVEILSRFLATSQMPHPESRIVELPLTTWIAKPGSKLTPWHVVRAVWDLALISLG